MLAEGKGAPRTNSKHEPRASEATVMEVVSRLPVGTVFAIRRGRRLERRLRARLCPVQAAWSRSPGSRNEPNGVSEPRSNPETTGTSDDTNGTETGPSGYH